METGHQVVRSANEIWWRANDPDQAVEQDEMKIAEREDTEAAVLRFHDICWALRGKGELVGYEGKMNPVVAVTIARDIKAALKKKAADLCDQWPFVRVDYSCC